MEHTYQQEQEAADRLARAHGVFVIRASQHDTRPMVVHRADSGVWQPPGPMRNSRSKPWAR